MSRSLGGRSFTTRVADHDLARGHVLEARPASAARSTCRSRRGRRARRTRLPGCRSRRRAALRRCRRTCAGSRIVTTAMRCAPPFRFRATVTARPALRNRRSQRTRARLPTEARAAIVAAGRSEGAGADGRGSGSRVTPGVIGLGSMGFGAATSLLRAGFAAHGCDIDAGARGRFEAAGGTRRRRPGRARRRLRRGGGLRRQRRPDRAGAVRLRARSRRRGPAPCSSCRRRSRRRGPRTSAGGCSTPACCRSTRRSPAAPPRPPRGR